MVYDGFTSIQMVFSAAMRLVNNVVWTFSNHTVQHSVYQFISLRIDIA